jgi:replication factor A3
MLKHSVGNTVRLVGKLTFGDERVARLETSDKLEATVHVVSAASYSTQYVEVVGKVRPDLSIEEFQVVPFGNDFDLGLYDRMLELANGPFVHLFR